MKEIFLSCALIFAAFQLPAAASNPDTAIEKKIVNATKKICLPECPKAFNPSIIKFEKGYLLTFRCLPNRKEESWISYIGVVQLDQNFTPTSKIKILDTRLNSAIPSQSEDARIFSHKDKLFIVYNDNMDVSFPQQLEKRDMYMAELFYTGQTFFLSEPLKLTHETKYDQTQWQKNWSPFEWKGKLMLSYMINPHEVLCPDLSTGLCKTSCQTHKPILWKYGPLRGGTPAQLVDGEYLAFFHSGVITSSAASDNKEMWHYYMGAYTFSATPPFAITHVSKAPIEAPGFYTPSNYEKRVIYPGGFVVDGANVHVIYGKDDSEIWVATMDLAELKNSMESFQ